jgi:hypothetical protein
MSINSLVFTPPPFKLPRLLLLNTEPRQAAAISLALGSYGLPFSFSDIYRAATAALLNEPKHQLHPPGDGSENVALAGKTYLRRDLEANLRDGFEDLCGPEITAGLMAHHLHDDMPYFACVVIEDAIPLNFSSVEHLCDRLIAIDALAPREIYWLSVSDDPADAMSKFPDWTIDAGIRFSAQQSASFTSPDEILSALEKLT